MSDDSAQRPRSVNVSGSAILRIAAALHPDIVGDPYDEEPFRICMSYGKTDHFGMRWSVWVTASNRANAIAEIDDGDLVCAFDELAEKMLSMLMAHVGMEVP